MVVAYLLNPLISWLGRKTNVSWPQAVLIVYALLLIAVGTGSFFLGLIWRNNLCDLESLPEFLPRLIETAQACAQVLSAGAGQFGYLYF